MSSHGALAVCQSGFEGLLAREMDGLGVPAAVSGPGWVVAGDAADPGRGSSAERLREAAFAHAILENTSVLSGERVNGLAQAIFELFAGSLAGERIEGPWPCIFAGGQDVTGLGRRVASVESAFQEILQEKNGSDRKACVAGQAACRAGPRPFRMVHGFWGGPRCALGIHARTPQDGRR